MYISCSVLWGHSESSGTKYTRLFLTIDQQVTVTEYRYPIFSLTQFFADVGGSIGLWLGMGLLQIGIYLVDLLARPRKIGF